MSALLRRIQCIHPRFYLQKSAREGRLGCYINKLYILAFVTTAQWFSVRNSVGLPCLHTLKSSQIFELYVMSHFSQSPLRHSSQIGQPIELLYCPPSAAAAAAAAPLCLLLQLSTYQMITHMSTQLLCWQTCVHWPWIGVPFPQLIN